MPPRWILEPTDKAFAQGSDAQVECKADGFPKPQVTWKRAEGTFDSVECEKKLMTYGTKVQNTNFQYIPSH